MPSATTENRLTMSGLFINLPETLPTLIFLKWLTSVTHRNSSSAL